MPIAVVIVEGREEAACFSEVPHGLELYPLDPAPPAAFSRPLCPGSSSGTHLASLLLFSLWSSGNGCTG